MAQFNLYLAYNPSSSEQSYIISDPNYTTLDAQIPFTWSTTDDLPETASLQVIKAGAGGAPLEGAEFTLTAGRTEYLTITDDVERGFTIKKVDAQNKGSLQGAVFRFEQIDGSYMTTGIPTFSLPFSVEDAPSGTASIAIVLEDKDAHTAIQIQCTNFVPPGEKQESTQTPSSERFCVLSKHTVSNSINLIYNANEIRTFAFLHNSAASSYLDNYTSNFPKMTI